MNVKGNTSVLIPEPTIKLCYAEVGTEPNQEFLTLTLKLPTVLSLGMSTSSALGLGIRAQN